MNRLRLLKQRAERSGVFIVRTPDLKAKWDVVDEWGTQAVQLSKRTAIRRAAEISAKKQKTRMYVTDDTGQWHRWNCEKVASAHVASIPCKCQRLVV